MNYSFNISDNILNIFTPNKPTNKFYELKQIHSDIINIADNNYINNTEGDALITNIPNTTLAIKTADCLPILIYDKENKVLALVHAGWRGVLNDITIKTLNTMISKYNSKPQNISVYIYPSIRKCHFEIEEDVYQIFKEKVTNIDKYTTKKDNYYIDLQQIIIDKLKDNNITNIYDSDICTYCNHNTYHSYRYNHTDKRNYLLAMIKED